MSDNLREMRSLAARSGLYDLFMPINYDLSLKKSWHIAGVNPEDIVADVGCGSGRLIDHACDDAHKLKQYLAIDNDPKVLQVAKRRRFKGSISYECEDITQAGGKFFATCDVVLCLYTFYTIDPKQQRQALKNLSRMLKVGGRLILTVPSNTYQVKKILADARSQDRHSGMCKRVVNAVVIYPLLRKWLSKIESNIASGEFSSFDAKIFTGELLKYGFSDVEAHETYGGNAIIFKAYKNNN